MTHSPSLRRPSACCSILRQDTHRKNDMSWTAHGGGREQGGMVEKLWRVGGLRVRLETGRLPPPHGRRDRHETRPTPPRARTRRGSNARTCPGTAMSTTRKRAQKQKKVIPEEHAGTVQPPPAVSASHFLGIQCYLRLMDLDRQPAWTSRLGLVAALALLAIGAYVYYAWFLFEYDPPQEESWPFTVIDIPGKGKGAIATRNISVSSPCKHVNLAPIKRNASKES